MDQDFRDAVVSIIDQYMRDNIHTSAPAKVGNVSENFTAELTPDLKITTDDDREVPYPKISGTAILMPTGAGGTTGLPFLCIPGMDVWLFLERAALERT